MINIENDPAAFILLFAAVVTVILLLILISIVRQQIYIRKLYERMGPGMSGPTSSQSEQDEFSLQSAEEELLSYNEETVPGESAADLQEDLRLQVEERRHLEDERGKDPAGYYKADSLRENLLALFERYKLKSFTMSTEDGLVVSSTDPDPEEDAARYSYLYQQGRQPDVANIRLIGVPYKGGTIVGIVKAEEELSGKELEFIERDIRFILKKSV